MFVCIVDFGSRYGNLSFFLSLTIDATNSMRKKTFQGIKIVILKKF